MDVTKPKKSIYLAYFYWLIGGFFGFHHFYLHRDIHAFITWSTFGGGLGLGWLNDFFRLRSYVDYYNQDSNYVENLINKIKTNKLPPKSWRRRLDSLLVSNIFAFLIYLAIPKEFFENKPFLLKFIYMIILPFSVATGVYLVGNIGNQKGYFRAAIKNSYFCSFFYLITSKLFLTIFFNSLISIYFFEKNGISWRRKPKITYSLTRRFLILFMLSSIYILLLFSWIWFNCKYTQDLEVVRCRKPILDFFDSILWEEVVQLCYQIKTHIKVYGIYHFLDEFFSNSKPESVEDALKFLDLSLNATSSEIIKSYHKLSRIYHPDKQKNNENKEKAQDMFILIQNSFKTLLRAGKVKRKL